MEKCQYCNKNFKNEELDKHELYCVSSMSNNSNLIPCEICNNFIEFDEYNSHISRCGIYSNMVFLSRNLLRTVNSRINQTEQNTTSQAVNITTSPAVNFIPIQNGSISQENSNNTRDRFLSILRNINLSNLATLNVENNIGNTYEELSQLDNNNQTDGCNILENSEKVNIENEEDCVICYDKFKEMNKLKCGHLFCYECLDEWLKDNKKCPICLMEL